MRETDNEQENRKEKNLKLRYMYELYYDEDYECYTCEVDLDEDEMAHFMQDTYYNCPYFQMGDEYKIVRKQM